MDIEPSADEDPRGLLGFHQSRGWSIAAGVALVALGLLAVAMPFLFTIAFNYAFGALLVVSGVVHAVHAHKARRWTGTLLRLLVAALYVIAGVVIFVHPLAGALALTLVLSAFLLAAGVTRILLAYHLRPFPGWGLSLASGILSVLLGGFLLFEWPSTALWAIGLYVGVDLLLAGSALIAFTVAVPALRYNAATEPRP
jgi:uncharacterized membrane protein HdeD (DUF308 family)